MIANKIGPSTIDVISLSPDIVMLTHCGLSKMVDILLTALEEVHFDEWKASCLIKISRELVPTVPVDNRQSLFV